MRYLYQEAVSFSSHLVRLYPRTDQKISTHQIDTTVNLPSDIQYRRDLFDNLVASCFLPNPGELLEIKVRLEVELGPKNPFHFLLAPRALRLPFEYSQEELGVLSPYREVPKEEALPANTFWSISEPRDTVEALVDFANTLHSEIRYETRYSGDARPPDQTLALRSGACRDIALLGATVLRSQGLAVRLVSGYLCDFLVDIPERISGSSLHAWLEVFLPGAGWIGIDPTNGTFCDHRFIATAVGLRMKQVAPIEGSYFGANAVRSDFRANLVLSVLPESTIDRVAEMIEDALRVESVELTMGGEPTFVPDVASSPEWTYAAVGPTKLGFAYAFAEQIVENLWPNAVVIYAPGKLYPGEVDPRWALQVVQPPDFYRTSEKTQSPIGSTTENLAQHLASKLGVMPAWHRVLDPLDPERRAWVLPLDWIDSHWRTQWWNESQSVTLTLANGPIGLRLPMEQLPSEALHRALVLEFSSDGVGVFLPPLLTAQFDYLLRLISELVSADVRISWACYLPVDLPATWTRFGLSADPGVLELNLPACSTWAEYRDWLTSLSALATRVGLHSSRQGELATGTGGGNHLLFGGRQLATNPFFTRPRWIASIARYWQHHPALAYLFSGSYAGKCAQAPRPDESGHALLDLELAYRQLEALPPGDRRQEIYETIRHLHTDCVGNAHRSELSFDKFWGPPGLQWGLLEFRALESLPSAEWAAAIALLWRTLLTYLLQQPFSAPLKDWGPSLHDRYLLPTALWADLTSVLTDLAQAGFALEPGVFREIWNWRFPTLLSAHGLISRRALEPWPILWDTPVEGGTTSRFVDVSISRLEFQSSAETLESTTVFANGRELTFRSVPPRDLIAGLRFRASAFYPALHPNLPIQMPLRVSLRDRETHAPRGDFVLTTDADRFEPGPTQAFPRGKLCEAAIPGLFTYDLRIEESIF
jgi:uncharacterized protein (DUF2126 family)/transglutaminase-like putative cysteine protease